MPGSSSLTGDELPTHRRTMNYNQRLCYQSLFCLMLTTAD